jgi:hypothetical protein
VNFVEHQQPGFLVPGSCGQYAPVLWNVVVEVLGVVEFSQQLTAECGFSDLPRTGQKHHLFLKIGPDSGIQITLHATILTKNYKKSRLFGNTVN